MGFFDVDEKKLNILYHRAWNESGRGLVDTRKFPYLDKALVQFARENGCSYDEALILAKTGKRIGRLAKQRSLRAFKEPDKIFEKDF